MPTTTHEIPRPIHPFPARMAASIPWNELRNGQAPLRVLDPMAGSGTTLVVARSLGHSSIGFDTDPLAVLLARTWCGNVHEGSVIRWASRVLERAKLQAKRLSVGNAYPPDADEETREFVRYWFDGTNRRQLAALASAIADVPNRPIRDVLWCAFSRLIITKQAGASLALDVAHSRPHRVLVKTVIRPLEQFLRAVRAVIAAAPFKSGADMKAPKAVVRMSDSRRLPLEASSIDVVISSPPYLNAIDYLRGHKFALVWMGHSVAALRRVRAENIGTEVAGDTGFDKGIAAAVERMGDISALPPRRQKLLGRYVTDMDRTLGEIHRVLVPGGRALLVVGDCTMRGVYVRNSAALAHLAEHHGFRVDRLRRRKLPPNRRYLPPPSSRGSGWMLQNRLRTEVLLSLVRN